MNGDELTQIETALGIRLPESYRALTLSLPVARDRATTEGPVWDVPADLIRQNLELREKRAWPVHLYCIGEDGGGSQFVIDLRETEPAVLQTEYEQIESLLPVEYFERPAPLSLSSWYDVYVQDLESDGIDIHRPAEPELPRSKIELLAGRVVASVFIAAIAPFVLSGILSFVKRLSGWPPIDLRVLTRIAVVVFAASGALMMWLGRERKQSKGAP